MAATIAAEAIGFAAAMAIGRGLYALLGGGVAALPEGAPGPAEIGVLVLAGAAMAVLPALVTGLALDAATR